VDAQGGNCTVAGSSENGGLDGDDAGCFSAAASSRAPVGGCVATENDFDGVPYQRTWPGSSTPAQDALSHPQSVLFSSPVFNGVQHYARNGFETDLPRVEAADVIDPKFPPCNRATGANCVNPPPGANFYPFFTTRNTSFGCQWQLGGANIPGTTRTFGGSSTAEFGPLLPLTYPSARGPVTTINNFRQVLSRNPC
jgi:hypothetical protein